MNIFVKLFGFNKYIDKITELEERCEKLENTINLFKNDDNVLNVVSGDLFVSGSISATKEIAAFK